MRVVEEEERPGQGGIPKTGPPLHRRHRDRGDTANRLWSVGAARFIAPVPASMVSGPDAPRLTPVDDEIAFTSLAMPSLARLGSISVVVTAAS